MAAVITIPKELSKKGDLVLVPRDEYEALLRFQKEKEVTKKDVLRWAREAKKLADRGKLPILRSLKDLR
jgi:hypothetical protein